MPYKFIQEEKYGKGVEYLLNIMHKLAPEYE